MEKKKIQFKDIDPVVAKSATEKLGVRKKEGPKIILPDNWSLKRKIWFWLTCWRPLTIYEIQKYNTIITIISKAIVNLDKTNKHILIVQEKIINNNNILIKNNISLIKDITILKKMTTGTEIDKKDPAFN